MSSLSFFEYVKTRMPNESNNYQAVMFKACIESGFDDDIKEGKSKPYAAKPPVVSTKELREKLVLSNLEKSNFDVDEALKSLQSSDIPYVSIGKDNVSLTLEFSPNNIPEIIKICNKEIGLK